MAGYLFDERTHLNDIYFRSGDRLEQYWTPYQHCRVFGGKKPVYVVTSHETFSGAEDFTYALKNLKRAKIIGEVTGGGAHPTRPFKVTDHFVVAVPFARGVSPITRTDWEGTGIEPEVVVPADDALKAAYRTALEYLVGTTTDTGC
jgi:C-terminal processing protease CtpA/Prc